VTVHYNYYFLIMALSVNGEFPPLESVSLHRLEEGKLVDFDGDNSMTVLMVDVECCELVSLSSSRF